MLVQKFLSPVKPEGNAVKGARTGERYISLKAPPSIWVVSCNRLIQNSAVRLLILFLCAIWGLSFVIYDPATGCTIHHYCSIVTCLSNRGPQYQKRNESLMRVVSAGVPGTEITILK